MKKEKIVIIGSGLGGLLSAALLSKNGYNVCVIEKNPVFGGNLQSFRRDGVTFDTGMHFFGSIDKGQFLYRLYKYLDIYGSLRLKQLDKDAFSIINYNGKEYPFAQGFENFVEKLQPYFPGEERNIVRFIEKIKSIGAIENLFNLVNGDKEPSEQGDFFARTIKLLGENTWTFIQTLTHDERLRNVLSGLNILTSGTRDDSNMYSLGMTYFTHIESSWRFVGGSDQLVRAFLQKIREAGGTVHNNTKATAFILDDHKKIKYVQTNQGNIEGDIFISNVHPQLTIRMLPEKALRKVYINRLNSLKNSFSTFSLYVVLKKQKVRYLNHNYFDLLSSEVWYDPSSEEWPQEYMYSTLLSDEEDPFTEGITMVSPIKYDLFRKWESTVIEKRGKEYLELKQSLAEKLLSRATERFPELKEAVEKYYAATPLTLRDYLDAPEGTSYGLVKSSKAPLLSMVLPKTQIANLFMTGQSINMHGMLGVAIGSLLTVSYILDLKKVLKSMGDVV